MRLTCFLILVVSVVCPMAVADEKAVAESLDALHEAAARADAAAYLALLDDDAVFLGTDGKERWQGADFRSFVKDSFSDGAGWGYVPGERRITLDAGGQVAWFDEQLTHAELGACRGSGVLVQREGRWQIAQYNLSVPIPNNMVVPVAQGIAALEEGSDISLEVESDKKVEVSELPPEEQRPKKRCGKRHKTNRRADC